MWWISVSTVLIDQIHSFRLLIVAVLMTNGLGNLPVVAEDVAEKPLTIFAAASLSDALPELMAKWRAASNQPMPRTSFAASAVLARQIEAGAPADIFLSANEKWVRHIAGDPPSGDGPIAIAQNRLVFATPCRTANAETMSLESLIPRLRSDRFAMADPTIAPAGEYTRQFLDKHGLWQQVKSNAAYAGNARLALLLIERGGISGFVYASDVFASEHACMSLDLSSFGADAVTYFGLNTSAPSSNKAKKFLAWVRSPEANDVWQKHGFKPYVPN